MDIGHGDRRGAIRRRLGFGDSPLRRRSDRWQATARAVVAVLFLAGCVAAAAFGGTAYQQQRAIDRLDEQRGYQTTATIVSMSASSTAGEGNPTRYTYRVEWQDNQGNQYLERFHTMTANKHGETLTLWVDHRGRASLSPPAPGQTAAAAVFKGFAVVIYVALGLAAGYALFLVALNRRRAAEWDAEWTTVEPRWRRQAL